MKDWREHVNHKFGHCNQKHCNWRGRVSPIPFFLMSFHCLLFISPPPSHLIHEGKDDLYPDSYSSHSLCLSLSVFIIIIILSVFPQTQAILPQQKDTPASVIIIWQYAYFIIYLYLLVFFVCLCVRATPTLPSILSIPSISSIHILHSLISHYFLLPLSKVEDLTGYNKQPYCESDKKGERRWKWQVMRYQSQSLIFILLG